MMQPSCMWVIQGPLRFPGPLGTSASGLVHTCVVVEHRSVSYVVWLNDYNSLSLNLEFSIWVSLSNLGDAGHLLGLRCRHRLLCSALHLGPRVATASTVSVVPVPSSDHYVSFGHPTRMAVIYLDKWRERKGKGMQTGLGSGQASWGLFPPCY